MKWSGRKRKVEHKQADKSQKLLGDDDSKKKYCSQSQGVNSCHEHAEGELIVSGASTIPHLGQWRATSNGKIWHQQWRTVSWLLLKVLSQMKSFKRGFLAQTLQSSDEHVWEFIAVLQPNKARASASCASFCSAAPTNIVLSKSLLKRNVKIYSYYHKLLQLIKK